MFAEASNARLGFIEEETWGVVPSTVDIQRLRFKNESLAATLDFTTSEEITPSASVTDIIPTGAGAGGDVAYEMTYGNEMVTMIEHALRGSMAFGVIKAGDAKKSMTLHKELVVDESHSAFLTYPGARVGTWSVDLSVDGSSPIGGAFTFLAKGEDEAMDDDIADSYIASNTNPVFSMPQLRGVAVTDIAGEVCFSDLSFTVENALRAQGGKCTNTSVFPDLDSKGIGYGQRQITGNMSAYLANLNIYDKFKSFGTFSLSFLMTDGVRGYKVTFPKIKITEGSTNAEGNDSDVLQPFAYQALYDTVTGTDMEVEVIGNIETDASVRIGQFGGTPVNPTDIQSIYYKNGDIIDGQPVYVSLDGKYALWSHLSNGIITAIADLGDTDSAGIYFQQSSGTYPEGVFDPVALGTGNLTSELYDPLA